MMLERLSGELSAVGLLLRGWFAATPEDGFALVSDRVVRTVVVVGNAGPGMWQAFSAHPPVGPDPLDRWTEEVLTPLAQRIGAGVVYPFCRPYQPFQQWAVRAEACHPSPIGLSLHPRYGLWHGLRGALLLTEGIPDAPRSVAVSPCVRCDGQPCLTSCPVQAFGPQGYDVPRCVARLRSAEGEDCMALGCRARRACPVGRDYRYPPEQARFHMESFLRNFGG